MNNTWQAYVLRIMAQDEQADAAERVGVSQATVSRWRAGRYVPTEAAVVASFARAYGRNPLEAFVAAGMLTEREAGRALSESSRRLLSVIRGAG